jgi:uncharacterized protein YggT (Ycf19 family)
MVGGSGGSGGLDLLRPLYSINHSVMIVYLVLWFLQFFLKKLQEN